MNSQGKKLGRKDYDNMFKLVLLGDSCVGKSCTLVRFADDEFDENYIATIGVDFRFRSLHHCDRKVKLQIWDTAGQERYRTITNAYYKGAEGIILVFDLFKRQTFLNLDDWLKEVEKHGKTDVEIIVIGNKLDLVEEGEREPRLCGQGCAQPRLQERWRVPAQLQHRRRQGRQGLLTFLRHR